MSELRYKERLKVWRCYVDWCLDNKVEIASENVITWLSQQGFLNETIIKRALKENVNE